MDIGGQKSFPRHQEQQSQELSTNNSMATGNMLNFYNQQSHNVGGTLLAGIVEPFSKFGLNDGPRGGVEGAVAGSHQPQQFHVHNLITESQTTSYYSLHTVRRHRTDSANSNISCNWCDINASIRCLECNEFMCDTCKRNHSSSPTASNHSFISLPRPIGPSPSVSTSSGRPSPPFPLNDNYTCDMHNEPLRYVCNDCIKLVCQCCSLYEHKEHNCIPIQTFFKDMHEIVSVSMKCSKKGQECIRNSIDRMLLLLRQVDRNCTELSETIRKTFRAIVIAVEDRENFLLAYLDKLRQRRLTQLNDQMAGLKSAIAGLSETDKTLEAIDKSNDNINTYEVAMKVTNCQRQLQQFAGIYKDLQPKHESYGFSTPDYNFINEIRNQGNIYFEEDPLKPFPTPEFYLPPSMVPAPPAITDASAYIPLSNGSCQSACIGPIVGPQRSLIQANVPQAPNMPITVPGGGTYGGVSATGIDWQLNGVNSAPLQFGPPRTTPTIPGSPCLVRAVPSNHLTLSFAQEGHHDGQVSRPWGICVDKMGNILVSDRRNNRVQVFTYNGFFKFKFGQKGVGNGEFDLPAGLCVDIDNRIIVVDKDNHRVQIFNANGMFLLKFGTFGKEYGQFQYPWDVAVNSRRQIVVTDSRNHRIQQFDSEGRFIRQIVFESHNIVKGIASPRGVCYTPTGNIIVTDFDNHCLYLVDPDKNALLAAKGVEGFGYVEFNRPSGICCDDEGRIIVADSKNKRIMVYDSNLSFLWQINMHHIRTNHMGMVNILGEKDRTCDVALMPDGRIVVLIELAPDARDGVNYDKRFVNIF